MNIFHRKHQLPVQKSISLAQKSLIQNYFPGLNLSLRKINYQCLKNLFAMFETIFPYSKVYFDDSKFHYTFAGNLVSLRVISAAPLDFKVFLCQRKVFLCQQKVSPCQRKPAYLLLNGSMTNHMLRSNNE